MMTPGAAVIAYLRDPREHVWGVLRALDPAGVTLEGCALEGVDGWLRAVASGTDARRDLSVLFFPMGRLERLLLDRGTPGSPSPSERFASASGMSLAAYLEA